MNSSPINVYTEITPNPAVVKFITDNILNKGEPVEYKSISEAKNSPLAIELFNFPFIKEIFISKNYISILKYELIEWDEAIMEVREFLTNYIQQEKPIFNISPQKNNIKNSSNANNFKEIDKKIISILDEYVKPAVEMDGGNIKFHSFKNGVVSLILQGACSGCPSSTVTLKSGIEQMLKQMLPDQIEEVIAINE